MKSSKLDKPFISDETIIRMFLRKLYEERMLRNDEYVVAVTLVNEKYETKKKEVMPKMRTHTSYRGGNV